MPAESEMVVILATGSEVLDAALATGGGWRLGGRVLYREAVAPKAARAGASVVVLACSLPGHVDLSEVVYALRRRDVRVILLAGDRETCDRGLLHRVVGLGVYDLLFDPVRPEEVARAIRQPAGFAGVAAWLEGKTAPLTATMPRGGQSDKKTLPAKAGCRPGEGTRPGKSIPPGRDGWPEETAPAGVRYEVGDEGCAAVAETAAAYRVTPEAAAGPPTRPPGHGPGSAVGARLIVFASPRAGVGRSFLALAFGIWLAGQGKEVVVLDLDGGTAPSGAAWRAKGPSRGGGSLFVHPSGLQSVRLDRPFDAATEEGTARLMNDLASSFGTVLVTLPEAGPALTRQILTRAERVFLVATPERPVLYDVQREFYHYRRLGLDVARVQLVLNRRGRRFLVRLNEVGALLPPALCTIVPEAGSSAEAALRGRRFRQCMADLDREAGTDAAGGNVAFARGWAGWKGRSLAPDGS